MKITITIEPQSGADCTMALLDVSRYCPVHDADGLYVASVRRKHALAIDLTRRQDADVAGRAARMRGIA